MDGYRFSNDSRRLLHLIAAITVVAIGRLDATQKDE